ncbi:MAG: hypothetical protein KC621_20320 [Myxococcales bacterium]|nr:hypothetical protein [Myxococcales bacterium]
MAKKPVDKQYVPRIDDPTAAFPIGVLAGLGEDDDPSEEVTTPREAPTPPPVKRSASQSTVQVGWLVLSLLVGALLASFVALLLGGLLLLG